LFPVARPQKGKENKPFWLRVSLSHNGVQPFESKRAIQAGSFKVAQVHSLQGKAVQVKREEGSVRSQRQGAAKLKHRVCAQPSRHVRVQSSVVAFVMKHAHCVFSDMVNKVNNFNVYKYPYR
jgi:hypothetical protein